MRPLLAFADLVDRLTDKVGQALKWLVLVATLISAGNALMRYTINYSSNAWLEIQWYLFAAMFLLAAGYALKHEEHVRVDVIFSQLSPRRQAWIDVVGGLVFLLPMALLIAWFALPIVVESVRTAERSSDAGGLLRWPVKIMVPVGFGLLALQGVAEIIKKAAVATGLREPGKLYERPVQ